MPRVLTMLLDEEAADTVQTYPPDELSREVRLAVTVAVTASILLTPMSEPALFESQSTHASVSVWPTLSSLMTLMLMA
jgi:hypothetical protein